MAGIGAGGAAASATGGGASIAGSTQPVAEGWPAATAADEAPHNAAAGAPALNAVKAAHGLSCQEAAVLAAAAVEPKSNELPIENAISVFSGLFRIEVPKGSRELRRAYTV